MITKRKYPWFGKQLWEDIMFVHWRISSEKLTPYIPEPIKLDTFDGSAWLSAVCFRATKSELRGLPINLVKPAIQLNIRTYVTLNDGSERGVYFFRLLLNRKFPVIGANLTFGLPFSYSEATYTKQDNHFTYCVNESSQPQLHVRIQPQVEYDESDLARFLTERYCIWHKKRNRLIKIPIIHSKWKLQRSEADIIHQQLHPAIFNEEPYLVHFYKRKMSYLFPYEKN